MECWCFWNPMATVCQYSCDISDILVPSCWVGPSLFGVQERAGVGQIQASRWSRNAVLFYSWRCLLKLLNPAFTDHICGDVHVPGHISSWCTNKCPSYGAHGACSSEVLTYTYEANSNSEACAPLDPASSFLNHMMLEVMSVVFSFTGFDTTVVWLTGFLRVVFLCDHSNKDSSFTSSFCGIGITKAFV